MQNASMIGTSRSHVTRGCVASASGIATCTGALAMQGGVAGQPSDLRLGTTFQEAAAFAG